MFIIFIRPSKCDATKLNELNVPEKLELIKVRDLGICQSGIGSKLGTPRTPISTILKAKVLVEIKTTKPVHIILYDVCY